VWATLRGDPGEAATVRIDIESPPAAAIGMIDQEDRCRILGMRAPGGTSYQEGVVRLSETQEPVDLIFDLHPLHLKGFGHYQLRVVLNDVVARETVVELKPQA
jgi:hypothetical protein